jgi:selenoprotein W-related protein
LTAELLEKYEKDIEAITLVPSSGGVFEISVDGKLTYSKLKTNRHVEPGEVVSLIQKLI